MPRGLPDAFAPRGTGTAQLPNAVRRLAAPTPVTPSKSRTGTDRACQRSRFLAAPRATTRYSVRGGHFVEAGTDLGRGAATGQQPETQTGTVTVQGMVPPPPAKPVLDPDGERTVVGENQAGKGHGGMEVLADLV